VDPGCLIVIRAIDTVRQSVKCVVGPLVRAVGRDDEWWFAKMLGLAASATPCALTGNQLGALYALSLDGARPVRVTVQPQAPDEQVLELLGECPAFGEEVRGYFSSIRRDSQLAGISINLGVGAVLAPNTDEIRLYWGCPEDQNYDALAAVLTGSDFWCKRIDRLPLKMVELAKFAGTLIGVARRFGTTRDFVFYYSIDAESCLDEIDRVAALLGGNARDLFRHFFLRNSAELETQAKWGWAIAVEDSGTLDYLKLEASAWEFDASSILPAAAALPTYQALDETAAANGLQLAAQTISFAVGPKYLHRSCYFRMRFPDETSQSHRLGAGRLPGGSCLSNKSFKQHARASYQDVERAVARAVAVIVSSQTPAGSWSDFNIRGIGPSDEWVTAHVGLKLATLPAATWPDVHIALDKAARHLKDRWRNGLAYSALSPVDADSTIHGLLFWQSLGRKTSEQEVAALLRFQLDDGGFSTFLHRDDPSPPSSWEVAHPEVTAMAIQALWPMRAEGLVRRSIEKALHWAEHSSGWDDCSRSFWWNLHWHARLQWAKVLRLSGHDIPTEFMPPTKRPFSLTSQLDAANLLELCLILDRLDDAQIVISSLVEAQEEDGLWPARPILRVVHPECREPWIEPHKVVTYADAGCYSSAAILSAMATSDAVLCQRPIREFPRNVM
jgi:hypothetical protein